MFWTPNAGIPGVTDSELFDTLFERVKFPPYRGGTRCAGNSGRPDGLLRCDNPKTYGWKLVGEKVFREQDKLGRPIESQWGSTSTSTGRRLSKAKQATSKFAIDFLDASPNRVRTRDLREFLSRYRVSQA